MPATATRKPETFNIIFRIGSTDYVVIPFDADPDVAVKAFRLKKPDGTSYDVRLDAEGYVSCECPGHQRHGHRGTVCKHVRSLRAARMLPKPDETPF